ncbi:MAG: hypothetical protein CVT60_07445 [Actinobacteria bacterium HGW-Actinobacteria-10]|nr:MAG: hypothetical protein CVT60_07445 [Actinobacteria bacterium HGW-Actinobacteria-10]
MTSSPVPAGTSSIVAMKYRACGSLAITCASLSSAGEITPDPEKPHATVRSQLRIDSAPISVTWIPPGAGAPSKSASGSTSTFSKPVIE